MKHYSKVVLSVTEPSRDVLWLKDEGGHLTLYVYTDKWEPLSGGSGNTENFWISTNFIEGEIEINGVVKNVSPSSEILMPVDKNSTYTLQLPKESYKVTIVEYDDSGEILKTQVLKNEEDEEESDYISIEFAVTSPNIKMFIQDGMGNVGTIGSDKTITLNDSLPSGEYTLKYEDINDDVLENWKNIGTITQ